MLKVIETGGLKLIFGIFLPKSVYDILPDPKIVTFCLTHGPLYSKNLLRIVLIVIMLMGGFFFPLLNLRQVLMAAKNCWPF